MIRTIAHAHTHWSQDSALTLQDWVEIARERACGAILLTEHEEAGWEPSRYAEYRDACAAASTPDVSLVPGIEFNQDGFHLLCYGLERFPNRPSGIEGLAAALGAQGGWLCLAHPAKYGWRYPPSFLPLVDAVEVWNSKWIYDGTIGPHPRTLALAAGKLWLVGQDVHKRDHLSPLYLEVATSAILRDLRAGRFRIALGAQGWTPAQLSRRRFPRLIQRARTAALRRALPAYRWGRRLFS